MWTGYNDLATRYPEIAAQWHPTKNGDKKPTEIAYSSNKEYWWFQPYDDPKTGKHFDFEWQAKVNNRTLLGEGGPFLGNDAVYPGYNDLASCYPEIAAQWHPTKNGKLTPKDVVYGTPKTVWWWLPYTDPRSGKYFEFEWQAPVNIRTGVGTNDGHQTACPYLTNDKVWAGYNDLASCYPEIASQWHPTKNGKFTPEGVVYGHTKRVWWYMPYDDPKTGKHHDFEWRTSVCARTMEGTGCPYLSNDKVWSGYNDLASCYPEIAAQWHPTKNRKKTPDTVYRETTRKYWWICPKCGHAWYGSVRGRTIDGSGCPKCKKTEPYYS